MVQDIGSEAVKRKRNGPSPRPAAEVKFMKFTISRFFPEPGVAASAAGVLIAGRDLG
jgi:hypothetical protein